MSCAGPHWEGSCFWLRMCGQIEVKRLVKFTSNIIQSVFTEQLLRARCVWVCLCVCVCVFQPQKSQAEHHRQVSPAAIWSAFLVLDISISQLANSIFSSNIPLSFSETVNFTLTWSNAMGEPKHPGPRTLWNLASAFPSWVFKIQLF